LLDNPKNDLTSLLVTLVGKWLEEGVLPKAPVPLGKEALGIN